MNKNMKLIIGDPKEGKPNINYNNLLIIAPEEIQETINMKEFDFDGCTGITINKKIFKEDNQNLRAWIRVLCKSHLLVTIGDWSEDKNISILIDIARKLNIPVIPSSNFKKYVSEKND